MLPVVVVVVASQLALRRDKPDGSEIASLPRREQQLTSYQTPSYDQSRDTIL